jgi:spore coat polysaccharide biosynthesis protein SpsF (cytidylyltransferase family)
VTHGEYTFSVHTRGQHFDLQWIPLSGYYKAPQRFADARAMLMLANPIYKTAMNINADFTLKAVIDTHALAWSHLP